MSIGDIIEEYKNNHSSYNIAFYTDVEDTNAYPVSDFVVANQLLLDGFFEEPNRIGALISVPDLDVSIFPLILYKCFANIYEIEDYSESVSSRIQQRQIIRVYMDMPQRNISSRCARRPAYTRYIKKSENGDFICEDINGNNLTVNSDLIDFFEIIGVTDLPRQGSSKNQLESALSDVEYTGIRAQSISKIRARKASLNKSIVYFCDKKEFVSEKIDLKKCGIFDCMCSYKLNDVLLIPTLKKDKNKLILSYDDTYEETRRQNEDYCKSIPAIVLSGQLQAILEWSGNHPVDTIYISPKKYEEFAMCDDASLRMFFQTCADKKIRVIAFSETHQKKSEQRLLNMFSEKITKIFQWSPDALAKLPDNDNDTLYEKIKTVRDNAKELKLYVYSSSFAQLSKALSGVFNKYNVSERPKLYERMTDACKLITHSVCPTESICKDLDVIKERIKRLSNNLENYYGVDNPYRKDTDCVEKMIEDFNNSNNAKFRILEDILTESKKIGKLVAVIVHQCVYEKAEKHFADRDNNIYVFSHTEFMNADNQSEFDIVVVCSYIGKDKILYYIENLPTKDLRFVFYDIEKKWFDGLLKKEKSDGCLSLIKNDIFNDEFGDLNNQSIINPQEKDHNSEEETQDNSDEHIFDDFDFWRSLKARSWGGDNSESEETKTAEESNELLDCIEFVFSNDSVMYCLPDRKLLKITDLFGSVTSISSVVAKEIKENDILLIRKTGRDIYTEIADKILESKNKQGLRNFANRWCCLLEKTVDKVGIDKVFKLFRQKGGSVSIQQMRNWYLGNTICPSKMNDLKAVLEAICELSDNDKEAVDCLNSVEKIYLAGRYIDTIHKKTVPKKIKDILKKSTDELKNIFNSCDKTGSIEEIGDVSILIVDEKNTSKEYRNRLMKLYEI